MRKLIKSLKNNGHSRLAIVTTTMATVQRIFFFFSQEKCFPYFFSDKNNFTNEPQSMTYTGRQYKSTKNIQQIL